ncbi:predicted protein [Naegleria gruberi]|uniref:Predicted protein n=1 Tax=Naegleria gruberi TaxID=5762 RepID=D2W3J4_NAEGR|nr:uncharacterized protein NAEGRDRAFT_75962 [Naegleria gruberi]EFC36343.1 predicted protein [Naegleria gruberi]|eukprot:XP_002669087.1 predicted protein [Naegleria gruberi strain NEG-M]
MGCMFTIKNRKPGTLHAYESVINFGTNLHNNNNWKPYNTKNTSGLSSLKKHKMERRNTGVSLSNNCNSSIPVIIPKKEDHLVSPNSTTLSSSPNSTCNLSSETNHHKIIRTCIPSIHELLN